MPCIACILGYCKRVFKKDMLSIVTIYIKYDFDIYFLFLFTCKNYEIQNGKHLK